MNKELCELTIIRLQTEMENAIGFREHYLKTGDVKLYNVWDQELDNIIDQILHLGDI